MTYLPQPWCTKDPRSTIKAVGIAEILISVCGLIILVTMPIIMLQLDHEINYIKQHHHGLLGSHQSTYSDPLKQFYILNITETYIFSCDVVAQSLWSFYDRYLNRTLYYDVSVNRSILVHRFDANGKPMRPRYICEVHVITKTKPTVQVIHYQNETVNVHYSFHDVCVACIQEFTGETKKDVGDKIDIISPNRDEISKQKIYPVPIGDDPERKACINQEMDGVDTNEVLALELNMYKLLGCSGVIALIGGFVLTSTAFTLSRFALMVTFMLEIISVFLMAGGIVVLNSPLLCLFQYGGISAYALDAPTQMQTIISYSCVVYILSFKLYLIWNVMAFAEVIPKMKGVETAKVSPKYSDYVAEVAHEVAKRNQKLAKGGKWSDEEDESESSDDSDQWSDEESSMISTSTTVASQRSVAGAGKFWKPGAVGPSSSYLTTDYGSTTTAATGRSTSAISGRSQSSRASFGGSGRSGNSGRVGNKGKTFQPSNTLVSQKRDKKFLDNSYFGH